jgi:hypothetical protein
LVPAPLPSHGPSSAFIVGLAAPRPKAFDPDADGGEKAKSEIGEAISTVPADGTY